MDLIQMARELGAAIQQDARYLEFMEAHAENDKDNELNNKDVVTLFRYVSNNNNPISTKPYDPNAKVMMIAIIPERTKIYR